MSVTRSGFVFWLALLVTALAVNAAPYEPTGAHAPPEQQPDKPNPAAAASRPMPVQADKGHVAQAVFTSGVKNRQPVDQLAKIPNSVGQVFFFTELVDLSGQTVIHRWMYAGKEMASVTFTPRSNHWRVWSSKRMLPEWTGKWTVQVMDAGGKVLLSKSFDYVNAATPANQTAQPPAGPSPGG